MDKINEKSTVSVMRPELGEHAEVFISATTRDLWHFGLQLIGLKLDDLLVFVRISQLEPLRTKSHL